uniref:Sugar transporter SWEET n=1 Tax=Lygus hesperus TaxID=30085 RepID=A0A0A9Z2V5_LYGHE
MVLEEYKDTLGRIAGSMGVLHLLIPAAICLQVVRQGSTENINGAHFMIGSCITLLKMRHGQLLNSIHMVTSSSIGFCMCMFYLSVYAFYDDNKKSLGKLFLKFLALPVVLIAYTYLDEPDRAEKLFGSVVSVMMFCLMSFPLFKIKEVIAQKHTGDLSLLMALMGSVQSTLWFLYSLALGNYIETLSRLVFCLMCIPQLVLFCIYPMPKTTSRRGKGTKSE